MLYEVTLTLAPVCYKWSSVIQFTETVKILRKLYSRGYIRNASGIAEYTHTFNIHYHLLVDFKTRQDAVMMLNHLRKYKQFGKKSCEQVRNEPNYREYMCKDIKDTHDILGLCPIVFDDLKVFCDKVCPCGQIPCQYKLTIVPKITSYLIKVDYKPPRNTNDAPTEDENQDENQP